MCIGMTFGPVFVGVLYTSIMIRNTDLWIWIYARTKLVVWQIHILLIVKQ